MNIGEPQKVIVVEPLEMPAPLQTPDPEPVPQAPLPEVPIEVPA